jgi:hypothetical protein
MIQTQKIDFVKRLVQFTLKAHKLFIIFIVFTSVFSCKKNNDNHIYYDLYINNDTLPVGAYRLSDKNVCAYYKYNYDDGRRYIWQVDDVIENNTWKYKSNGLIEINGWEFSFKGLSKDTIILQETKGNKNLERLIKSKNQEDMNKIIEIG